MARRNTPPRGSATPGLGPPPGGSRSPERGRPTVQELSALELVVAVERAREQQRRPRFEPTRKEARELDLPLPEDPPQTTLEARQVLAPEPGRYLSAPRSPLPRIADLEDPMLSERPTMRVDFDEPGGDAPRQHGGRHLVLSGIAAELAPAPAPAPLAPVGVRALPQRPAENVDLRLIMQREPDSARAAAFRVLRYRIEQQDPNPLGTRVIALCAPRPGHGATTAAANLALALCECDRARVCLLEANLRRPALAQLFRFKPPVCFSERLGREREQPLEPWCVAEISPSLHVLAAREATPPRPLVDGPAFAAAVDAMRRTGYRYVIVDGPEVLGIADMNLVEESVDDVLLVAKGGTTTATELRTASTQLSSRKLRGVVLLDSE